MRILAVAIALILSMASLAWPEELILNHAQVSVFFSPKGGAQAAIIGEIEKARESVRVMAYSFTSAPIADALLSAHKRGVNVEVVLDKSQATASYSGATFLRNVGIPVWIDRAHAIAHNKIMIIDGETVITGSFNFTKAAEERNAENILIVRDKNLAQVYMVNWEAHLGHSARE